MSQRAFVAIAVLWPLLGGCHDPGGNDPSDPSHSNDWKENYEFVWEGDHLTVHGFDRSIDEACGGSFAFADAYVATLSDTLGFDRNTKIDYQWMSPAFFADKCPPDATSCTASGVARSPDIPQMHEIVHAVTYQNIGVCPSVLEEGMAEYFGDPRYEYLHPDPPNEPPSEAPGSIESMLTAVPIAHGDYRRAGHFVSFLAEKYGIEAVVELCAAMQFESTRQDWERASSMVLGVSVDELLANYAKYPSCTQQQYRARLMECSGDIDHVIEPGMTTEFSVEMDCRDEHVIGPVDGQMIVIQQIQVEQPLYALVEVSNDAGLYPVDVVASQACKPCSANPRLNGNVHPTVWFALDAGRHALMFYLPADQVDTFNVKITPISGDG